MLINQFHESELKGFLPGAYKSLIKDTTLVQATKSGSDRVWNTTTLTKATYYSGVHEFFVNIAFTKYGNILVGLTPASTDPKLENPHLKQGFFCSMSTGKLFCKPHEDKFLKNFPRIQDVGLIGICIDFPNQQIWYSFNCNSWVLAFENINVQEPMKGCVLLYDIQDAIKWIVPEKEFLRREI